MVSENHCLRSLSTHYEQDWHWHFFTCCDSSDKDFIKFHWLSQIPEKKSTLWKFYRDGLTLHNKWSEKLPRTYISGELKTLSLYIYLQPSHCHTHQYHSCSCHGSYYGPCPHWTHYHDHGPCPCPFLCCCDACDGHGSFLSSLWNSHPSSSTLSVNKTTEVYRSQCYNMYHPL